MFQDVYKNKKVLVTGHTGFKGSWLTTWLLELGANVIGISNNIPTKPSMFEELKLEKKTKNFFLDIRDLSAIEEILSIEKPDFVFHLAAQPIVSISYKDPIETIASNVLGTSNILESLRKSNHNCVAVIITSDKAYDNVEQVWGYKENDKMGGKDIYSGSKGAAELVIKSYFHSFFKNEKSNIKIGIGRAGNVIGGGDWASDRIVVDCMEAWSKGNTLEIRAPKATRPWQHVLEPVSGYLNLGSEILKDKSLSGESYNFGPKAEQNHTVEELIIDLSKLWNFKEGMTPYKVTKNISFHEASQLKLNCDKALAQLKWQANFNYKETIKATSEWYFDFYNTNKNMYAKTTEQINYYENLAKKKGLMWSR